MTARPNLCPQVLLHALFIQSRIHQPRVFRAGGFPDRRGLGGDGLSRFLGLFDLVSVNGGPA